MEFTIDLQQVRSGLEQAEVLSLFFPLLRKTLVVDFRCTVDEAPLVRLAPMARSLPERMRSVRRMRPHWPRPRKLLAIPWPRYVDSLFRLQVADVLLERVAACGHPEAVRQCREALEELRRLERRELAAVVQGENYHTIWARKA
ncbi:MAG: hypothetical protein NZ951_05470 [Dehalococcoidia bacterium]|nr:hypothetical protein [Dehalococcoidia bacterium]MDW8120221.1 hypothetical protein [Chloroflexota bacterium]